MVKAKGLKLIELPGDANFVSMTPKLPFALEMACWDGQMASNPTVLVSRPTDNCYTERIICYVGQP